MILCKTIAVACLLASTTAYSIEGTQLPLPLPTPTEAVSHGAAPTQAKPYIVCPDGTVSFSMGC